MLLEVLYLVQYFMPSLVVLHHDPDLLDHDPVSILSQGLQGILRFNFHSLSPVLSIGVMNIIQELFVVLLI